LIPATPARQSNAPAQLACRQFQEIECRLCGKGAVTSFLLDFGPSFADLPADGFVAAPPFLFSFDDDVTDDNRVLYLPLSAITTGLDDLTLGTLTLTAPLTAGDYDLRFGPGTALNPFPGPSVVPTSLNHLTLHVTEPEFSFDFVLPGTTDAITSLTAGAGQVIELEIRARDAGVAGPVSSYTIDLTASDPILLPPTGFVSGAPPFDVAVDADVSDGDVTYSATSAITTGLDDLLLGAVTITAPMDDGTFDLTFGPGSVLNGADQPDALRNLTITVPGTASIGDFVWFDTDGDTVQDAGEPGIDGATVNLYEAGSVTPLATTTTAGGGAYSFDGLFSGDYSIEVVPPAGYQVTSLNTGAFALAKGQVDNTHDAGLQSLDFTVIVEDVVIEGDPAHPVNGYIDIYVDVPAGLNELMAGYEVLFSLSAAGGDVTLSDAVEAPDAIFPGQTPQSTAGPGGSLLVTDAALPPLSPEQSIDDGDGLVRLQFTVAGGVTGTIDLEIDALNIFDAMVKPLTNFVVQHGSITVSGDHNATVVDAHVFYNNSAFDGNNPAASEADDNAVATDKRPLLPGDVASLVNYTSYSLGLNGLMIDIANLPDGFFPDINDFAFRVGNNSAPATWAAGPVPISVDVRHGAGVNGSDRVTIIFADRAMQKQWLQVTVLGANLGMPSNCVLYYGSAVAEAGNAELDTHVTTTDLLLARNNPRSFLNPAEIGFSYDYNRDRRVNVTDVLLARNNQTNFLTALKLLDLSASDGSMADSPVSASDPDDAPVSASAEDAVAVEDEPEGIVIDVGEHVLLPNRPGQVIEVLVSGGDAVQAVHFYAQIGGGGPELGGVPAPAIESVDILTGTIFEGNNIGQTDLDAEFGDPDVLPQWEGIWNRGSLTLLDSTLARNAVSAGHSGRVLDMGDGGVGASGGGVCNSGDAVVAGCLFLQNKAGDGGDAEYPGWECWSLDGGGGGNGGGIAGLAGSLVVANTTFSENLPGKGGTGIPQMPQNGEDGADGSGGGLHGTGLITNCTFVGNDLRVGSGGIVQNTIVAEASLPAGSSHNLTVSDAMLGPLTDNGGPTMTCVPQPGSPAINAGSNRLAVEAGLTHDQRGFDRFVNGVDIGAVELAAPSDTPRIHGAIWNDLDADGEWDVDEPALEAWDVFVDLDLDGRWSPGEPSDVTDALGKWEFLGLPDGSYRVREVPQEDWQQTHGGSGHFVNLGPGQAVGDVNFGNHDQHTSVSGFVWEDLDGDGQWDNGESELQGWRVFVDFNLDGELTSDERWTVTNASGEWRIDELSDGSYSIREVPQSNWRRTYPGGEAGHPVGLVPGQEIGDLNFGNQHLLPSIFGVVWEDLDGDGKQDPGEPGLDDILVSVYIDDGDGVFEPDGDDAVGASQLSVDGGTYNLPKLGAGKYWLYVDDLSPGIGEMIRTYGVALRLVELFIEDFTADFGYRPQSENIIVSTAVDEDDGDYSHGDLSCFVSTGLAQNR